MDAEQLAEFLRGKPWSKGHRIAERLEEVVEKARSEGHQAHHRHEYAVRLMRETRLVCFDPRQPSRRGWR